MARLGGDEFLVVLRAGRDAVMALAARIAEAVSQPYEIHGRAVVVEQACGRRAGENLDGSAVVRRADRGDVPAKREGSRVPCLYSATLDGAASLSDRLARTG
jgi:GGDEF domain-containing protein